MNKYFDRKMAETMMNSENAKCYNRMKKRGSASSENCNGDENQRDICVDCKHFTVWRTKLKI